MSHTRSKKWKVVRYAGKFDPLKDEFDESAGDVTRIETEDGEHVCGTCDGCNHITRENARLIISAPDLLEALKQWLEEHDDFCASLSSNPIPDVVVSDSDLVRKARTAIAKAEGES